MLGNKDFFSGKILSFGNTQDTSKDAERNEVRESKGKIF